MIALDLFAGTGWGVACQWLGIEEHGVELMDEAVATRDAAGMRTVYRDVWDGLTGKHLRNHLSPVRRVIQAYELLIASPPCQTFSMAGKGSGRRALDEVLEAVDRGLYRDPVGLRAFGADKGHDDRTALVLAPLAYVWRDRPMFVAMEQVPPVLPVWEACAAVMRELGYSVWVGKLHAEQFGVPQTRTRAILIARRDGVEAAPPTPTHSRYYSTRPHQLDIGVKPWVSMAEALGWGMTERPTVSITGGSGRTGAHDPMDGGSGARAAVKRERDRGAWAESTLVNGTQANASARNDDRPAGTLFFGERLNAVTFQRSNFSAGGAAGATAEDRGRTMRHERQPSVSLTGKPGHWVDEAAPYMTGAGSSSTTNVPRRTDTPAHAITGAGTADVHDRATVAPTKGARAAGARRITVEEASRLQSYPAGFPWQGTRTKQYLQIGNAVPPMLARAVLEVFIDKETK